MLHKIQYEFNAIIWQHSMPNGWYFISLPKEIATEIRAQFKWQEEGWGRLKAIAKIGNTEWETAIWYDSKHKTYLLPLKAEIRKKETLKISQVVDAMVWI